MSPNVTWETERWVTTRERESVKISPMMLFVITLFISWSWTATTTKQTEEERRDLRCGNSWRDDDENSQSDFIADDTAVDVVVNKLMLSATLSCVPWNENFNGARFLSTLFAFDGARKYDLHNLDDGIVWFHPPHHTRASSTTGRILWFPRDVVWLVVSVVALERSSVVLS